MAKLSGAPGGPKQTALRRLPIRPDVYRDMTYFSDKVNPFRAAGKFNKSAAREKNGFARRDLGCRTGWPHDNDRLAFS